MTENNRITLKDFINDNANILTVFGIFNALTIYASSIENKYFSLGLSFLFMTIAVIVWLQLWSSISKVKESWLFDIFQHTLTFTTLGLILFWFYEYRLLWQKIIFVPSILLSGYILGLLINKTKLWHKIWPDNLKNKWSITWRVFVSLFVFGFLILLLLVLTIILRNFILGFINWIDVFVNK